MTTTEGQCSAWRALDYSGRRDSAATIRGIRVHNETGVLLGCWAK